MSSSLPRLVFFCFSFISLTSLHAQFAVNLGGTGIDEGRAIDRDGANNIYITGAFSGTADFDPGSGTANLTSAGNTDIFVAKYNANGAYQWAIKIGGSNVDGGYGISVDGSGNVYVTGTFRGSNVDFDPGSGTANLSAVGNQDVFIAKYSSSGAYQWAIKIGSSNADYGYAIDVDATGDAYVTGYYQGTADFDPGSGTSNISNSGQQDGFVAKYSSAGAYQWAFRIAGSGIDYGYGIRVEGSAVHVVGVYDGTVDFDPSGATANQTSAGMRDIFVAKYTLAGAYTWAISLGGTDNDYGYGITTDASGNVYVAGYIALTADMDPSGATANLISAGGADIFCAKYSSSGAYQMSFRVGSTGSDMAYGIALDGSGNILVTGVFQGNVDFDPGSGTATLIGSGPSEDAYIAKYSGAGAYLCALKLGGGSYDYGYGIVADGSGGLLTTGYFNGTVDFDPGSGTINLTSGSTDVFLAKYGTACTMISSVYEINPSIRIDIFPNPSPGPFQIECEERITLLKAVNLVGDAVYTKTMNGDAAVIDLSGQPEGIYFLECFTEKGVATRRLMIVR